MTTNTEIKPGTEVSIEDGDLLIAVTDGYGELSILRYPLPKGGAQVEYATTGRDVVLGPYRVSFMFLTYLHIRGGGTYSVSKEIATEIAEILLGGPLPDAPHNCTVPGCTHGHAA